MSLCVSRWGEIANLYPVVYHIIIGRQDIDNLFNELSKEITSSIGKDIVGIFESFINKIVSTPSEVYVALCCVSDCHAVSLHLLVTVLGNLDFHVNIGGRNLQKNQQQRQLRILAASSRNIQLHCHGYRIRSCRNFCHSAEPTLSSSGRGLANFEDRIVRCGTWPVGYLQLLSNFDGWCRSFWIYRVSCNFQIASFKISLSWPRSVLKGLLFLSLL